MYRLHNHANLQPPSVLSHACNQEINLAVVSPPTAEKGAFSMAASVHDADTIETDPDITRGHVRSMPDPWAMQLGKHFIMCDRGPRCRGDACTFAHSTDELNTWNTQLEEWRQLQRDGANLHTPKYEETEKDPEPEEWREEQQPCDPFEQEPLVPSVEEAEAVLTQQSYQSKFHSLLSWEKKQHIELLSRR